MTETIQAEQSDFITFCKDVARKYFKEFVREIILLPQGLENMPFHDELDDEISQQFDPSTAVYKMIQRFFAVITYPRDHGKSKHLSVFYPLWRIADNHNIRILSISRTAGIAESFLSEVVSNIERNANYISYARIIDPTGKGVVPRLKKGKKMTEDWSGSSITIDREDVGIKDPTIAATGLFGQILSRRADLIICDDVVDQQNSMTDLQRRKVIDWIETTVLPVLVPGGTFIYLGNTWHMEDVVSKFMKDPRFIVQKRAGAIIVEAKRQDLWTQWGRVLTNMTLPPKERFQRAEDFYQENREAMDEGWQTLWPERYPYSRLYLERLLNPYVFARMYQCDPSNRPDQKFRDEWIERALTRGRHLKMQNAPHERNVLEVSAAGLDVAAGLEAVNDDTAIDYLDLVRYGYDGVQDGDFIIRDIHRGKLTFEEQAAEARAAITNGMRSIRVESNGYQKVLAQRLKDEHVVITDYTTTGREKFDPEIGIGALTSIFERDQIVIPCDDTDQHTMEVASKLATELRAYTGDSTEHTGDSLMALWFAYSEILQIMGTAILIPSKTTTDVKDSPNVADPTVRAPLEKEADTKIRAEQEYLRGDFNRQMMNRLRRR
jgi:hypothetical protein